MFRQYVGLVAAAVVLTGCWTRRQVEVVSGGEVTATRVDAATGAVLPAGADLSVRIDQTLSTEKTKTGDRVTATVWSPVIARNGDVVVPRGAKVYGKVTGIDDSDDPTDRALIQIDFVELEFLGKLYPVKAIITDVSNVVERRRSTGEIIQRTATGAAAGAAIGAIISGADLDAIIKGGVFGATAGAVISLGLGDVEHVIPEGTPMMLRVRESVLLR